MKSNTIFSSANLPGFAIKLCIVPRAAQLLCAYVCVKHFSFFFIIKEIYRRLAIGNCCTVRKFWHIKSLWVAFMNEFQLYSPTLIDVKDSKKIDFESVMPK